MVGEHAESDGTTTGVTASQTHGLEGWSRSRLLLSVEPDLWLICDRLQAFG
jgi:hypothetical protein